MRTQLAPCLSPQVPRPNSPGDEVPLTTPSPKRPRMDPSAEVSPQKETRFAEQTAAMPERQHSICQHMVEMKAEPSWDAPTALDARVRSRSLDETRDNSEDAPAASGACSVPALFDRTTGNLQQARIEVQGFQPVATGVAIVAATDSSTLSPVQRARTAARAAGNELLTRIREDEDAASSYQKDIDDAKAQVLHAHGLATLDASVAEHTREIFSKA